MMEGSLFLPIMLMWDSMRTSHLQVPPEYIRKKRCARVRPPRWDPWFNTDLCADEIFLQYFRMGRNDFLWLCERLRSHLQLDPLGQGNPLSVEAQVAVGPYHLGHRMSHITVGHVLHIGKETSLKTFKRFFKAVIVLLHKQTIGFPNLNEDDKWKQMSEAFQKTNGIPNIIGAIDGTHIPIAKPQNDKWNSYINRKGWNLIIFQCVVDGDGNYCNVNSNIFVNC